MQDAILPKKGDMIKHLSIIICTFNRGEILFECLNAIKSIDESLEIIVVNNNKDDNIEHVKLSFPNVKFVAEPLLGLSHARNRGVQESKNDWLFFLDDDAILLAESVDHIFEMTNEFDLCTGIWKAWYKSPAPNWLPYSTGNYILRGENQIRDIGDDYVSGGVMLINKQK
ncbi:MAG: glycosyltransferase involved in cell wall biosynthesis, partial [Saprospiraceae bacterium]